MKKTEGSNTEREDWERKTSTHREIDGERERERVKHTNTRTLTHTHTYICTFSTVFGDHRYSNY